MLPSARLSPTVRALLTEVESTTAAIQTAAAPRVPEGDVGGVDPATTTAAAAAAAAAAADRGAESGAGPVPTAGARLRQLIADINATCHGKPYHSLPLLPVDGETGAPCGFFDNAKGLWYSRSDLAQCFVTFLRGKGYDADALLALAYRMMLRSGGAPGGPPRGAAAASGKEDDRPAAAAVGTDVSPAWALECLFSRYTALAYTAGLALESPMEKAKPKESVEDTARRCCREEAGVPACTRFVRLGGIIGRDGRVNVVLTPQSAAWRAKFTGVGGTKVVVVGGGGGGGDGDGGGGEAKDETRAASSGGGGAIGLGCINPHGMPAMWLCVPRVQDLRSRTQKSKMECCCLAMRTIDQLRSEAGHPFCYMVDNMVAISRGDFSADNVVSPQDLPNFEHNGVMLYFADAAGRIATQRSDRLRKKI